MAKEVVFVHTTKEYGSYADYRSLTRLSGFEICNENQIDSKRDCIYVVSPVNESVISALKERPKASRNCKIVWLFLERIRPPLDMKGGGVVTGDGSIERFKNVLESLDLVNLFDKFWFADRSIYNKVRSDINSLFIPVGSDERLGSPPTDKAFDITHMSYVAGRRVQILNGLKGLKLAPNAWGEERRRTLSSTKFMYCAHQDDDSIFEPLRFAVCSAFSLPLICETCADPFPYEANFDFKSVSYQMLVQAVRSAVASSYETLGYLAWADMGNRMWEKGTQKYKFVNNVKQMALEITP
jgi:hypothetical protein